MKHQRKIGFAKGEFTVPPSLFEPLPDDLLAAFNGELDDFNAELGERLRAIEDGEVIDPSIVRTKLQEKSRQRRREPCS